VLGASVPGLVRLLARDFAALVAVAFAVGAPVAFVLMRKWLEDFAYPVDLGPGPFVLVGLSVFALALLAVSFHAVRTATADPVKALRYE
jgi:putative ABC transport system permease protein